MSSSKASQFNSFHALNNFEKKLYQKNRWKSLASDNLRDMICKVLTLNDSLDRLKKINEILNSITNWPDHFQFILQLLNEAVLINSSSDFLEKCRNRVCKSLQNMMKDSNFLKQISPINFASFILLIRYKAKLSFSDSIQQQCSNSLMLYLDFCPLLSIKCDKHNFERFFFLLCKYGMKDVAKKCFEIVCSFEEDMVRYIEKINLLWGYDTKNLTEEPLYQILKNIDIDYWQQHFENFFAFFAKCPDDSDFNINLSEIEQTILDSCLQIQFPMIPMDRIRELQQSKPVMHMLASHPNENVKAVSDSSTILQLWSKQNIQYDDVKDTFNREPYLLGESKWDKYLRLIKDLIDCVEKYDETPNISKIKGFIYHLIEDVVFKNQCLETINGSLAPLTVRLARVKEIIDIAILYNYPPLIQLAVKHFNKYVDELHLLQKYDECLDALLLSCDIGDLPTQKKCLGIF